MNRYMEEQNIFEQVAECMVGCEQTLFECVRKDPLDRCECGYTNCETQCEVVNVRHPVDSGDL